MAQQDAALCSLSIKSVVHIIYLYCDSARNTEIGAQNSISCRLAEKMTNL